MVGGEGNAPVEVECSFPGEQCSAQTIGFVGEEGTGKGEKDVQEEGGGTSDHAVGGETTHEMSRALEQDDGEQNGVNTDVYPACLLVDGNGGFTEKSARGFILAELHIFSVSSLPC